MTAKVTEVFSSDYLYYNLPRLIELKEVYTKVLEDRESDIDEKKVVIKRLDVIEECIGIFEDNGVTDKECSAGDILEVLMDMPLEKIVDMDSIGSSVFNDISNRLDKTYEYTLKKVNGFASWLERKTRKD